MLLEHHDLTNILHSETSLRP